MILEIGALLWTAVTCHRSESVDLSARSPSDSRGAPERAKGTVDLAAVGDVMLARYVGRRIEAEGADSIFAGCREELSKADIAFGNLECVLGVALFASDKRFLLCAKPERATHLANSGFDVMSVANNHALDCGVAGLTQTLAALRIEGIQSIGSSGASLVLTKKGVKIALLAYCDFPIDSGGPGIRYTNEKTLALEIKSARFRANAVIVAWHWGTEGSDKPNERQRRLARLAANAGADVILGSHSHVLQPIQWLKTKSGHRCLVAYSLGNFIFDAPNDQQRKTEILHVQLTKFGAKRAWTTPYRIHRGAPSRSIPH